MAKIKGNAVIGCVYQGDFLWFRMWCTHVPGHSGEMIPVFTEDPHEALQFVYPTKADAVIAQITKKYPDQKLFRARACEALSPAGRRLLKCIFAYD